MRAGDTLCHQMERRMSALRAAVAQHRGTFLRTLSKAIGFPSRPSNLSQNGRTYGPDDGLYSFESSESRLRQLADMYFMIGQYRDAEGCYADVAEEFKARRSTPHYAAALEALALSRYMQMTLQGALGLEVWKCALLFCLCLCAGTCMAWCCVARQMRGVHLNRNRLGVGTVVTMLANTAATGQAGTRTEC
jgi:hypothetical protein